jgi:type I restriction enzyme S subunit
VRWGSFDLTNLNAMRFEESEHDRYGLQFGDIVICEGGEPGRCAIWREEIPDMKFQKALHRVRIRGNYSNQFVYYRFLLAGKNGELEKHFIGSTIKHLTGIALKDVEFVFPSFKDQQKIAAVLSALDAKIELNQRINAELESMAKTLYDYWFVQNKNVGKLKVGKLGDFIGVNERSITKDYPHSEIEYIDIASVSVGRLEGKTKYSLKDAPSRARRLVKHGDTIWSTVRPNRKSYLFICNPKENLVVSTGFAVLSPKKIPPSFLYFLTTTEQFVNFLVSNAEGSAYPAVSADRFAEMEFLIPPEKKLQEFENIVSPMLAKISKNELESQTLTELRDWLLPLLMNGQVKV